MGSIPRAIVVAVLMLITGIAASCGQKGPLYLPDDNDDGPTTPESDVGPAGTTGTRPP